MSDTAAAAPAADATPTASTNEDASAKSGGKPDYTPPASQADLDKIVADRIARERAKYADYDDLKDKAAKFTEIENASKSDLEKAQQRADEAERKAAETERRALRAEVAAEKGVPVDLLTGSTKDEIEAAADRLLEFSKGAKPTVGSHLPNQDKSPQKNASGLADTARKLFGGQ